MTQNDVSGFMLASSVQDVWDVLDLQICDKSINVNRIYICTHIIKVFVDEISSAEILGLVERFSLVAADEQFLS